MKKVDVKSAEQELISKLIFNTITPRPIAWVTTLNENGTVNLAPFSFYNAITTKPPLIFISIGKRKDGSEKDTARNIRRTGEFAINVVTEKFIEQMIESGKDFPPEESEIEKLKIETSPSQIVSPPFIKDVPAALECKTKEILELGSTPMSVIIGEVVYIHYTEDSLSSQKGIIGRLGGKRYTIIEKEITPI